MNPWHQIVETYLEGLNAREKAIFAGRALRRRTLRELGEQFGVCGERVRQIESRIFYRFKRYLASLPHLPPCSQGRRCWAEEAVFRILARHYCDILHG